MSKEIAIPKAYVYTINGVEDDKGALRKFSIASLSRDIYDEFDLDGVSNSAALSFYLENEEYQQDDKWPLTFKFLGSDSPVEIEMNLSHSPCFLSTPKKVEMKKKSTPVPVVKKTRKPSVKKVVTDDVQDNEVQIISASSEVKSFVDEFHGYLVLEVGTDIQTKFGASISDLTDINHVLTSIKAVATEEVGVITVKYKEELFYIRIASEFYHLLNPVEIFDPTIAEEGELPELLKEELTNDNPTTDSD